MSRPKRIPYCALKDIVINPGCKDHCHHDPNQCWYFLLASNQEELNYFRQIYRRRR